MKQIDQNEIVKRNQMFQLFKIKDDSSQESSKLESISSSKSGGEEKKTSKDGEHGGRMNDGQAEKEESHAPPRISKVEEFKVSVEGFGMKAQERERKSSSSSSVEEMKNSSAASFRKGDLE